MGKSLTLYEYKDKLIRDNKINLWLETTPSVHNYEIYVNQTSLILIKPTCHV